MRKASDYMFFLITGSLLIFSLASNILNATIIPISIPVIIFSIIFFLIAYAVIFYNHYTFLTTLGFLTIAALILLLGWDESREVMSDSSGIRAYFTDLILFVRGYLPYENSYGPVITFCVCGFLALYITLSLYVSFQFYFTAILGIGIFTVNWIMEYKRSDLSFVLFVFCFCVLLYKKLNNRKPDANRMSLYIMPIGLLIVVFAYMLPVADKKWDNARAVEFFRNPLEYTNDFFYFIFNPKYFSFQTTGFEGRDGRLGGSLTLNNRDIMRVAAERPTYLAGLIKDTYTGNAWIKSNPGFTLPYSETGAHSEAFETQLNMQRMAADSASSPARFEAFETQLNMPLYYSFESYADCVSFRQLTINIGSSRTGTIFRPVKNNGISIQTDLDLLTDSLGDLRLSDVLPANAEYSFEYMDIDYSDPVVLNLLRKSYRGIYRQAIQSINISWYIQDNLIPYSEFVYETFLGVPDTVPQRVKDLAIELTSQADNDYDRAKALESYLIQFPYTLMPGMLPQDRDFVDYFLFDGKEGYCTYYASAMAILCRLVGLPSRYVEGYIMPPVPSSDGLFYITNLQAHAWAEVYLEGFGWTPFEPTAPFSYNFYNVAPPLNAQVFTPGFASDPYYDEYRDRMMGGSMLLPRANVTAGADDIGSFIGFSLYQSLWTAVMILFLSASCIGCLILKGKYELWRRQKYIKGLPRNEQAIEYFRDILKMTRYYRYPMHEHETHAVYAKRIGKRFAFKSDSIFIRDLVNIYYKAKFSGAHLQMDDLALMKICHNELLELIRYMRRKPVFIWNRYITRRI